MSMQIRYFSQASSSACERVRIALAYKGVPFELVQIDQMDEGAYRALNPQGLMPAMEVDGQLLTQSMAMLELLEEVFPEPSLLPKDPIMRAKVRAFAQVVASDIHPPGIALLRKKMQRDFGASEAETTSWYNDMAQSGFAVLERMLKSSRGDGPYCFGKQLTFADITMVPHMHTAQARGVSFANFPLVMEVFKHCVEQPAFIEAARENQPDGAR